MKVLIPLLGAVFVMLALPAGADHHLPCDDESQFNIKQSIYSNWSLAHPEENTEDFELWQESNGHAGLQRSPCIDRWGISREVDTRLV